MSKIHLAAPLALQDDLLRWLQDEEVIQLTPLMHENVPLQDSDTGYKLANLQSAINFTARVREELNINVKKNWRHLFSGKPVANLVQLEKTIKDLDLDNLLEDIRDRADQLHKLEVEKRKIEEKMEAVEPWTPLRLTGKHLNESGDTVHKLMIVSARAEDLVTDMLDAIGSSSWQAVQIIKERKNTRLYLEVVVHKDDSALLNEVIRDLNAETVSFALRAEDSLQSYNKDLEKQLKLLDQEYAEILQDSKQFLPLEKKLQFAYDAFLHRQERENVRDDIACTQYATVLSGWIPSMWLPKLKEKLAAEFKTAHIEEVPPEDKEVPPVAFDNNKWLKPFEAVTNIYGKPAYHEIDPSPALSIFFLAAFGLALSDAGYGILMVVGTILALRYFRLKREMRKMVKLLSYAGVATALVGFLTGSWFGIELTALAPGRIRDFLLSFKLIDPVSEPITLLIIAFILGILQLLFAWVVRGYHHYQTGDKTAILLDDIPWIAMIVFILGWAGTKYDVVPVSLGQLLLWLVIINAVFLILTQGRAQKNIFLRLASGVLSLYGLITFLSDTLSYSRLLALGLATSIIGLVVNMIAGMTSDVPFIGLALAIIVLILGHTFNIGINTLGAFIHSGRLQFVEFFPKFMEGGGTNFKPFGRTGKYIDNPKEFS